MAKKIYVGNLPWAVDDAALAGACSPYGVVKTASVVNDRETGRSRGFGFVEFENDEQAQAAISGLNGSEMDGRKLVANEAREKSREGNGGGSGGGRSNRGRRDDY